MTGDQASSPRYRLDSRIATGGMGEVWRATDTVLEREVAVKVLKPEHADDPTFRSRFQTEAQHAAALHHPNVASVFDFGELPDDDGSGVPRPYLVMELVPGQPLSALLRPGEPMPAATAADLVAQSCDAVAAAHAIGVVHRDIKPGNLLVTPRGQVKITDFGIARAADAAGLTQTGQVIGTPAYFAPEQAEGKTATEASDVYSLGVVLYECLAGRRPFTGETPIATALAHLRDAPPPLPDSVPRHLRDAVSVALAKDPAERFASASDLARVLRGGPMPAALAGGPGAAAAAGAAGAAGAGGAAAAAAAPPAAPAAAADEGTRVLAATGATAPVPPAPPRPGPPSGTPPRRSRPPWLPWVAAAAAVLALVLLVAWLGQGDEPADVAGNPRPTATGKADPTPTVEPSPEPSEEPSPEPSEEPTEEPGVEVVAEDYVGLLEDEAKDRLEELGLKVKSDKVDNPGDAEEGTVASIAPTGTLQEGDEVTLSVYDKVKPEPAQDAPGQDPGEGGTEDD